METLVGCEEKEVVNKIVVLAPENRNFKQRSHFLSLNQPLTTPNQIKHPQPKPRHPIGRTQTRF